LSVAPEQRVPEDATALPPAVIMVVAPDRPRKGETIAGRSWAPKFGGKGGNQAVAARRQGIPTAMVGAVGDDSFGAALLAGLDRAKVTRQTSPCSAGWDQE
jgi:sugar/nucleoside kinase (ribokinase family)